jgi:cytidylate kinase
MPSPTDLTRVPVHGFRGDAEAAPAARPRGPVVAISRQAGSRGTTIARKVAEILQWEVFDYDTLDYLTHNETARAQLLADVPADALAWADAQFARLVRARGLGADGDAPRLIRLVLAVAARGSAVVVGRAAGFLLPAETTVHVRIVAPLEARVAYLAQELRLSRPEALEEVRARDHRRAIFLETTLGLDPNDLTAYDAVVNSDRLGVEGAAQFVGWAARTKQMFRELAEPLRRRSLDTLDELTGA